MEELFLLALRAEKPARSNREYIVHLYTYYVTVVSSTFITEWFKTRFDHKGSFRKPNIVPLDKFRAENVIRFIEYKLKCQLLFDHSRFCFIDEKHLVNSDSVPKKTTLLSNLEKNGLHCSKQRFPRYVQSHGLHQWKSFEGEVCSCAYNGQRKWHSCCLYDEIIVMDNAAIHTGGASAHLERFLGEKVVDGRPLHILVVYLPTWSPELNPIELVFHIFARRVIRHRLRHDFDAVDRAIIRFGTQVLDEILYEILKCYQHYMGTS